MLELVMAEQRELVLELMEVVMWKQRELEQKEDGIANADYVVDMTATQSTQDPWSVTDQETPQPAQDAPSSPHGEPTPAQDEQTPTQDDC